MIPHDHDPGDEDRSVDLYCRNCGDPFDAAADRASALVEAALQLRDWQDAEVRESIELDRVLDSIVAAADVIQPRKPGGR